MSDDVTTTDSARLRSQPPRQSVWLERPELLASIVREVLLRLSREGMDPRKAVNPSAEASMVVPDRVVTVATIERLSAGNRQLELSPKAVVTPAAIDEAKRRGVTITRSPDAPPTSTATANTDRTTPILPVRPTGTPETPGEQATIVDNENAGRAESVRVQLARRGTAVRSGSRIVLSDHPAKSIHEETIAGRRAAMVRRFSDIDRFDLELRPNCWILDMVDLNLAAAVNAAQRILELEGGRR